MVEYTYIVGYYIHADTHISITILCILVHTKLLMLLHITYLIILSELSSLSSKSSWLLITSSTLHTWSCHTAGRYAYRLVESEIDSEVRSTSRLAGVSVDLWVAKGSQEAMRCCGMIL